MSAVSADDPLFGAKLKRRVAIVIGSPFTSKSKPPKTWSAKLMAMFCAATETALVTFIVPVPMVVK